MDKIKLLEKTNPLSPYYTPTPKLTDAENLARGKDLTKLYQIAQLRESPWPQFDGMGYMKYNETNEMADISYIPPKKNKGDTRITTGVTHEKDSSTVSFFTNLKFEGNVRVFYKDTENFELGDFITKLVRKSREIEDYENKRINFYRNIISQGTAFSREQFTEIWVPEKEIQGEINPAGLDELKWQEKGLKKIQAICESVLVDGKKVFLENIREPDINKQPSVYTVEYTPRELLESIWGQTKMWKYVPYITSVGGMDVGSLTQGSIYSDWVWGEVDYTKCEVVMVYKPFEQVFQIYINGVPMLPVGFPLKAISPSGLIPIAKGDLDLMNMFAYSKSDPAKMKVDQAVFDELLQTMVMKSRQSAQVPRGNLTGRILTPEMFLGGRIITNLDPKDVPPLIETPGITNQDFSFYELFKAHIDSKSISSLLEGNNTSGDMTLGQYMDMQKRQMLKLGIKIDGIINWERQMLRLRTMNLLQNAAQKTDDGNYKDISVEASMYDGGQGLNVFKFSDNNYRTSDDVFQEELNQQDITNKEVQIYYINPNMLKEILGNPDYYFYYEIVPVDKNNDKLSQMMFVQMVTQAMNLFGPQSLQVSSLKKRYAQVMGESFDKLFVSEEQLQTNQMQAQERDLSMTPELKKDSLGLKDVMYQ